MQNNVQTDLNAPLFYLAPNEPMTVGQAFEGICVFGGTGSGKTSGSGKTIAQSMLRRGWGGLVLTAKADERELWERYAAETGRSADLIIVKAGGKATLNLLDYEHKRNGEEASFIEEIANVLNSAVTAGSMSGGSSDPFWDFATRQLLVNSIDLLALAGESLNLCKIMDVIRTAPTGREAAEISKQYANACSVAEAKEWMKKHNRPNIFERTLRSAFGRRQKGELSEERKNDLSETETYWLKDFAELNPKTRSSVLSILTSKMAGLMRSPFRNLFSSETTVTPEDTFGLGEDSRSKILIIDLPYKKFGESGRFAQILFKQVWQRAVEKRGKQGGPVFLWADEAQYFTTKEDALFQQTARSSRAATVYLSQSVPNYCVALGESGGSTSTTDALLGNFQTIIFHSNGCPKTNEYAQRLFGEEMRTTTGSSQGAGGFGVSTTSQFFPVLPANVFGRLKKGGLANNLLVEAYVFQAGRLWGGKNWLKTAFSQVSAPRRTEESQEPTSWKEEPEAPPKKKRFWR